MSNSAVFGMGLAALMACVYFVIWWRGNMRVERARRLMGDGARLIDVDPPEEFARDHLDGAENVPLEELERRSGEFGPADQPVVIYGRGAFRAKRAAHELRSLGFRQVMNLGSLKW